MLFLFSLLNDTSLMNMLFYLRASLYHLSRGDIAENQGSDIRKYAKFQLHCGVSAH